jgi:hypothetical protein
MNPDNDVAKAKEDLWGLILECYKGRLPGYTMRMRKIFETHKEIYDQLVTRLFGALEEVHSELDYDLGDHLMTLHTHACTIPVDDMKTSDYQTIVRQANLLLRLPHFEIRLMPLLRATFATELIDCIALLSRPQRAFDTAVRTARTFPTFTTVRLHQGLPVSAQPATIPRPQPQTTPNKATSVKTAEKNEQTHCKPAPTPAKDPKDALIKAALAYLPPHERQIGLHRLESKEKKDTFFMVVFVLSGQVPDPNSDAYIVFGFVACRTENERQKLGGIYQALLTELGERVAIPTLCNALRNCELTDLMDTHGYFLFRQEIPELETFLLTPWGARESVWHLIQFVRMKISVDSKTEINIHRVLQLDYAFDICKTREHVVDLQGIYRAMLNKVHPLQVHKACMNGTLLQAAKNACPGLTPDKHRFLQSRKNHPGIGFVGTRCLAPTAPFFKKKGTGATPP